MGPGQARLVSNINFFMNVPVDADGTLGIVDGLSAPGKSLALRAEIDTWCWSRTARRSTTPATASTRRRSGWSITAVTTGDHRSNAVVVHGRAC